MFGLSDDAFIRGKAPMTKRDIRALSLIRLGLDIDSKVLDIGAGTGSVSIEAARHASRGMVTAVERDEESVRLIHENKRHFNLDNLRIIEGLAPDALPDEQFDAVFIGGSGGNMTPILEWAIGHLVHGGRLVINTITIENSAQAVAYLRKANVDNLEVIQVAVSKGRFVGQVTMMEAQNPITIISCVNNQGV